MYGPMAHHYGNDVTALTPGSTEGSAHGKPIQPNKKKRENKGIYVGNVYLVVCVVDIILANVIVQQAVFLLSFFSDIILDGYRCVACAISFMLPSMLTIHSICKHLKEDVYYSLTIDLFLL